MARQDKSFIVFFTDAVPNPTLLGGKGSNIIRLVNIGANVPPGFIITTKSYIEFLEVSENQNRLNRLLSKLPRSKDVVDFSESIRTLILETKFPNDIEREIRTGFKRINEQFGTESTYAVRSSATIEDMDTFSFAGQCNTYLNNSTFEEVLFSVKNCWASLFSPQALSYFLQMRKKGSRYSLSDIRMAVIVQRMVDSQISGVLFTANVLNNNKDQLMINSTWGLGETIANNSVVPDMIILGKEHFEILRTALGRKEKTSIKSPKGSHTVMIETDRRLREKLSLTEKQLRGLHELGLRLESALNSPQDIEWAIENDRIYVLQARPITTLSS
jgi:phosphoenolpyruvate synthase/pyruvate phosphate dikinase